MIITIYYCRKVKHLAVIRIRYVVCCTLYALLLLYIYEKEIYVDGVQCAIMTIIIISS